MKDYSDKMVLITGASSGIGVGFARAFHSRGARVVLVARRKDKLEELAAELNNIRPHSAEILAADIASQEVQRVVQYIESHQIDVLINNAGRGSFDYFENLSRDEEVGMVELNVVAPLILAHAAIPQMKKRRSGAIIAVSSIAGFQPLPYMATYGATKAFNLSHAIALHYELAPFGVKVLAVCPGPVETEFFGIARVPGKLSGMKRDGVIPVVEESMKALDRGALYVTPCLKAKIMWMLTTITPRRIATALTCWSMKSTLDEIHSKKGTI